MTPEEEGLFRKSSRVALEQGGDIAMVVANETSGLREFMVLVSDTTGGVLIVIPAGWEHEPDAEDRCQAILREEQKALTGQALD